MAVTQAQTKQLVEVPLPEFIQRITDDYKAKTSHVFILYGNVNDFSDNSGNRHDALISLARAFDDNMPKSGTTGSSEVKTGRKGLTKIFATYNLSSGLDFPSSKSKQDWMDCMIAFYGKKHIEEFFRPDWDNPLSLDGLFFSLTKWFAASKQIKEANIEARNQDKEATSNELLLSIVFTDADALFPDGSIAQMTMDRTPIVHVRNWARDESLGDRNRIVLMTRHLTDIHESIRGAASGVSTHSIAKPNLECREEWLKNFSQNITDRCKKLSKPMIIGSNEVTQVSLAEGFDLRQFAVQAAGMSRRQMEAVIMRSWLTKVPVDYQLVRIHKQKALEDEYQGIVDFYEPENGFEQIGGHTHLKRYFQRKIIQPLRTGDKRLCSSGMLMTGPPGTGKTAIAKALAKEAKMNFMMGHLDKLFGGLVGETETKTRKFLEAVESAAPVIVFLDELDSVLSSGRQSKGDSGTSARMFNAIMQWLSDESRKGKVVVIGASNRPDLLDAALIRSGRFDAKIPALPPFKGDAVGRKAILDALCNKHRVRFAAEVKDTEKTANNGMGRLLLDKERVWTGAEIEVVLKEALDNANFAERKKKTGESDLAIRVEDWNKAMDEILPNTKQVEFMTKLSLFHVDHLGYCPEEWRAIAADKDRLAEELGLDIRGDLGD
jgi:transitional endoplasmic reticulum ATPase